MRPLPSINKKTIVSLLLPFGFSFSISFAQEKNNTSFTSSDKELELAFKWARSTALSIKEVQAILSGHGMNQRFHPGLHFVCAM
jgi:hypothetical protein